MGFENRDLRARLNEKNKTKHFFFSFLFSFLPPSFFKAVWTGSLTLHVDHVTSV